MTICRSCGKEFDRASKRQTCSFGCHMTWAEKQRKVHAQRRREIAEDDAILAGILRRHLAENHDAWWVAENVLHIMYGPVLDVSDEEQAAIARRLQEAPHE